MLFESWLLLHAADLAEHAATHLMLALSAAPHESQVLLEEITYTPTGLDNGIVSVNGGCSEC
ncbi:hypothetical protein [Micromonospora echinofusca]|uniref:Uncharacterized protein n=1 Tax=Micromonospora echinofusca TaxID=47858 RepID=A0A1C5GGQ9_MICEH|nr:hypothetical protein [Micromonospora echinofusca]SCG18994.1 hypothetical protein GA0070610_5352 [Micromonospora echinofusca]